MGVKAGQQLDQRAFACPILATERMNFALGEVKGHIAQGNDTGELFDEMLRTQNHSKGHAGRSPRRCKAPD
jgi:hypothetical protein